MAIKQFSQTDPQWKSKLLGFDKTSTIGGFGCLLTSFTMCATHYGAPELTPDALNEKMKAVGGFQAGTAYIIGGALGNLADRLSLGAVVDFLHVFAGRYSFPAFNLADSAITLGVAALLVDSLFGRRESPK